MFSDVVYEIVHGVFLQDTYCVGHYGCAVVREARPNVTPIIEKSSEAKIKHATEGYHKIWCWHGVS
jgi:hypothetical protein